MVTSNGGKRIDTIEKMRNKRHFRAEFDRIGKARAAWNTNRLLPCRSIVSDEEDDLVIGREDDL